MISNRRKGDIKLYFIKDFKQNTTKCYIFGGINIFFFFFNISTLNDHMNDIKLFCLI